MARRCDLTAKGVQSGCRVSHAKNRRKHRFLPNLHRKRIWSPALGRFITLRVAAATLRTIDKVGVDRFLAQQGGKH